MFKIVHELRGLNSRRLEGIAAAFLHLSGSINGLAREAEKSEKANAAMERRKMSERDKQRLPKNSGIKGLLWRDIWLDSPMTRSQQQCHGIQKIYKHIQKIQIDLAILKDIETDILKEKVKAAHKMTASRYDKKIIVRRLNISAHYVQETNKKAI